MELLEGENVADRIARGPMPIEQILRTGIEIADALAKAHRRGVSTAISSRPTSC